MSSSTQSCSPTDKVRDVIQWQRKKLSIAVVLVATSMYVLMEVYSFNFVTVASWAGLAIVGSLFLWGNILRLLGKEGPRMSGLEITEESTKQLGNSVREWIEEGIRWMFRVGAEQDCLVFARTVATLWFLSFVGNFFDFLTFAYAGIVAGMTVPVVHGKYGQKMKVWWERLRVQLQRFYGVIEERWIKKLKDKLGGAGGTKEKKEKKIA